MPPPAADYEDDAFTAGCPQRSTSTLTTPGVGTAAQPRPYRPGYLTPNDANPGPALIQSITDFDPFNYYTLSPTFQVLAKFIIPMPTCDSCACAVHRVTDEPRHLINTVLPCDQGFCMRHESAVTPGMHASWMHYPSTVAAHAW